MKTQLRHAYNVSVMSKLSFPPSTLFQNLAYMAALATRYVNSTT